jgi:Zn-dependent protease with chaperone function
MTNASASAASAQSQVSCTYCGQVHAIKPETLSKIQIRCSRCKLLLGQSDHHSRFRHMDPAVYRHPLDHEAQDHLKALPGVDNVLKKLLEYAQEAFGDTFFAMNCLRAGTKQFPDLHAKLQVACQTLGMTTVPDLYVAPDGLVPGSAWGTFSGGLDRPFIVFPSSLLDRLTEEEVLAVLAHEIGHFHCNHHALKVAADFLMILKGKVLKKSPMLALLDSITPPVQNALFLWRRKADLSADRTSLLVLQNTQLMAQLLAQHVGGQNLDRVNLDEFLAQASNFERQPLLTWLEKSWPLQLCDRVPAMGVWRMAELLNWTSEEMKTYGYSKIIKVFAA